MFSIKIFPKVKWKEYTKICLYLAVMDDEICRNELEGNFVDGKEIVFPPKSDSLQYRYHLFLQTYKSLKLDELEQEVRVFEKRLKDSKRYISEEKIELEVELDK